MNFTFSFCFQVVDSDAKRLGRGGKDRRFFDNCAIKTVWVPKLSHGIY